MSYVTRNESEGVNDLKGCRSNALLLSAAIAALMVGAASPAHAQVEPVQLEGIIIEGGTLSGEPTDAATLGSATTVITGEELERRQIRHAADALRTVPGLDVGRTGGVGGLAQVRVRGAEANQVKVIIDGVEVNSLSAGDFQFETLLAENIERIEVIRGPQSGIYGANALAGVINISTKKGTQVPKVSAQVEGGSLGTYGVSANASGAGEFGYLSVSAAKRETDGFNIARTGSEDDGSEQETIFARAGLSPTDFFRIDVLGRFQSNFTESDRSNPPDDTLGAADGRDQLIGRISAELDTFGKTWTHKVFADYLEDDTFSEDAGLTPFTTDGARQRYGYRSTLEFSTDAMVPASHVFVGLAEKVEEQFESSFGAVSAERANTGFAGEYRGAFDERVFLNANIRHDDKDSFEDATTYRLSGAYLWPALGTRLHASYGKGITDPTFFEQFGLTLDFQGNPDLKPEESIGWDAGVEQTFFDGRVTADVTYFEANLTDEIVTSGFGSTFTVENEDGESKRKGVEVTISARLTPQLSVAGSYTYTDATNPDGSEETRRPPHSGSLDIAYSVLNGRGRVNATAVYNGETKDEDFSTSFNDPDIVTLDDYLLVNIAGSYKLDENFEVFGRVENLLDTDYEEVFGYSTAPVTAYGGVKLTLGDAPAPLETGSN